MTVVNKPDLKPLQLSAHLPADLGPLFGGQPFLFCESPMGRPSRCKPRKAVLGLRSAARAAVDPTTPHRLLCGRLARSATPGLGAAPLAGPIGAKSPWNTLLKVCFCHAKISTSYEVLLYPTLNGVARRAWLGPRPTAQAKPSAPIELKQR